MRFTPEVMRFTGAHEIGHALMHPGERKHRDRPVSDHVKAGYVKSKSEKEADYFAASYLIPGKLLQSRISDKFGKSDQIIIDDNMAHFLSPNDPQAFLESDISTCAAAIATVERFGGVRSLSLASQFGVSVRAMSIRLQELNMVTF